MQSASPAQRKQHGQQTSRPAGGRLGSRPPLSPRSPRRAAPEPTARPQRYRSNRMPGADVVAAAQHWPSALNAHQPTPTGTPDSLSGRADLPARCSPFVFPPLGAGMLHTANGSPPARLQCWQQRRPRPHVVRDCPHPSPSVVKARLPRQHASMVAGSRAPLRRTRISREPQARCFASFRARFHAATIRRPQPPAGS